MDVDQQTKTALSKVFLEQAILPFNLVGTVHLRFKVFIYEVYLISKLLFFLFKFDILIIFLKYSGNAVSRSETPL